MQRQSNTVIKFLKSAMDVEDSVTTNRPEIGPRLDLRFAAVPTPGIEDPEGEAPSPSFQDTMVRLQDGLATSRTRLATADRHHVENLRRFLEVREVSRNINGRVYSKLGVTRRTIEEVFEDVDAFVLAGLESPTSRESAKLLQQADLALERLKSPDLRLPKPQVDGLEVKPETLVRGLSPEVEQLRDKVAELRQVKREVQKSRKIRNEVLEEHKNLFLWTARTFESYYQLAGEPELAAQIRPSGRRPGRRAVEVAEESAAEGSEAAEAPASEAPETPESPAADPASATATS